MAFTTIQISEETKSRLFKLINELERKWGRRVTYDEAIEYLMKEKAKKRDKKEFLKHIKKFQGILELGEGSSLLRELRRNELERRENVLNLCDS